MVTMKLPGWRRRRPRTPDEREEWMATATGFAERLTERGLRVVRFEFPYMAERRRTGKRRPPDRENAEH